MTTTQTSVAFPALTPRQQAFVDILFENDFNQTQAYIRAGYKAKNDVVAATCGSALLRLPQIAAAVAARRREIEEQFAISRGQVLRRLAALGFQDPGDVLDWGPDGVVLHESTDLTPEQRATVASISYDPGSVGTVELEPQPEGGALTRRRGDTRPAKMTVRFHDPKPALETIAKIMGYLQPDRTVFNHNEIKILFVDDWQG